MNEVTSTIVNVDDQDLPVPLYKYRDWNDRFHKTILTNRTLYFAAPTTFDDKLEFRNFKRFDLLNDQEIYDKYLSQSFRYNHSFNLNQHSAYAMEWTQKAPFKDPVYLRETQLKQFEEYNKRVGVLSLCKVNDSVKMWNLYAKQGEGFCVGFDTYVLAKNLRAGFAKVEYPIDGLPIISGTDSYEVQTWKQTYNKTIDWEFEKEFRFYRFDPNLLNIARRSAKVPSEAYLELIFGWRMKSSHVKDILSIIKAQGLNVNIFIARPNGDNILIERT